MLENVSSEELVPLGLNEEPAIDHSAVRRLVFTFLTVVSQPSLPRQDSPRLLIPNRRAASSTYSTLQPWSQKSSSGRPDPRARRT